MSIEVIETHTILPDIMPGSVVVDCRANVGRFSLQMITRFGCICYAIEAAPDTFNKIPSTVYLHRYNFALCATNKLTVLSIDEDTTRSTIKESSKKNTVAVQGRHLGEFLANRLHRFS